MQRKDGFDPLPNDLFKDLKALSDRERIIILLAFFEDKLTARLYKRLMEVNVDQWDWLDSYGFKDKLILGIATGIINQKQYNGLLLFAKIRYAFMHRPGCDDFEDPDIVNLIVELTKSLPGFYDGVCC